MTATIKLITEQTTNQLVDAVNRSQANGWFPICGVVCFNARYTQLMVLDTDATESPKCNYFIVDAADGGSFAQRVNQLLDLNPGAVCLSPVQYVQARYIQAYGDDSHGHANGGGGGNGLKWYTQDAAGTYPIIDVDPNFSQIGLGNEWAGYVQLLFRTGGNNAGYILADDGTMLLRKKDGSELQIMDNDVNLLVKGTSVLNSNAEYTNLIANGSHVTLAPGYAGMSSPGGYLTMDENNGLSLVNAGNELSLLMIGDDLTINDVGGIREQINADRSALVAPTGTADVTLSKEGFAQVSGQTGVTLNAASNKCVVEMDESALRIKRGTNNLFSISDSGGAMTWNSMIRCVWDANGWNVSRDNGVAFTSRATYAAMMGPGDSRVETGNATVTMTSNQYSASAGTMTLAAGSATLSNGTTTSKLDATGFTMNTPGEYHYNIDGIMAFFSSGDITKINALNTFIECDNGAGINIRTINQLPITIGGGPLTPSSVETLGSATRPWSRLYLDSSTPFLVQTNTSHGVVPVDDIAKMATVTPKALNTASGDFTMGYMYEDIIAAYGTGQAKLYGLADIIDGAEVVNPVACLMMEALYVRSRLP